MVTIYSNNDNNNHNHDNSNDNNDNSNNYIYMYSYTQTRMGCFMWYDQQDAMIRPEMVDLPKKKKSQQWRNGTAYFWTNLHREYDEYVQTGSENKKQRHAKFLTPQGMWGSKNTCGILLIQPHCKWLWSWDRRESISVACCFCPFNVHPPVWTYTWEKNTT